MILAFSVNVPLPDLPKLLRNGELSLRTSCGDERRIILKLRTCTFMETTLGNSINDSSFFGEQPFT